MEYDLKEILDLFGIVLRCNDGCVHCKHYKMDKFQCCDCDYQDTCASYDKYELDLDKVKKDYLMNWGITMDKIERGKRAELNHTLIDYYKRNPDKFLEEFLGLQLLPYQKAMLKIIGKTEKIYFPYYRCSVNEIRRYKDG